ncbi:MAG: hypothetical protein Q8L81_17730 [Bacteroidota bacterium]|nr:hypothetical protein [Bacteroidota bacterium]
MEYFILKHAIDTYETGSVDRQIIWTNPKKIEPNPLFIINKARDGEFPPDFLFPFDYLELNKGAKLSDLMSSQFYNGFIVSAKLKKLLEESNVKDYKFYDIILYNKEAEIKGYYYFHSASCLRNYIDYSKSTFFIGEMLGKKIRDLKIKIETYDDLIKIHKDLPMGHELLYPDKFYLSSRFPFSIDLFRLGAFNYDFFISKRLKEMIESNHVTGVSIKPVEDFIKTSSLA